MIQKFLQCIIRGEYGLVEENQFIWRVKQPYESLLATVRQVSREKSLDIGGKRANRTHSASGITKGDGVC